ncbi:MAG: NAD(P)-dependent oxidoreductase [Chitinispirillaceae bacterium]|nr:NAD(P)-dependent oxidoreductase [Chitinispirillaceae bacterium]
MTKKKLLVTGAGGFLGWNICRTAVNEFSVTGVYRMRPVAVDDVQPEKCDLTDFSSLRELFLRIAPDAVIHAAAESRPDVCQEHPGLTKKINVDASLAIAGLCGDRGIPCAFTSSDLVFDGKDAPYGEERAPSPISVYGEQKAAAEAGMPNRCGSVIVCRMPLMYGDAPPQAKSFIQPFISAMLAGKKLGLFSDEFRTPASGGSAARGLLLALKRGPGILHLGGRERLSRYDFGVKLARALGLPGVPLAAVSRTEAGLRAPRPADVSLDSRKAFGLGYDPLSVTDELNALETVHKARQRA